MADRDVTLKLNVSAKAVQDTFRALTKDVQQMIGGTKNWQQALSSVNSEIKRGRAGLALKQAQLTPDALSKRVRLQMAHEEADKKLADAEAKERARQYQPQTMMGKLGKRLGLDVSPGNKGSQSLLGSFGKGLGLSDEAAGVLGGIGKALGPVAIGIGVLTTAAAAFKRIAGEALSLVQIANPGAVKRFNMAWEDMLAVIGHRLTPMVNLATKAVRLFADFLATILPGVDDEDFKGLDDALKELRLTLQDIAPIIKEQMNETFRELAFLVREAAAEMKPFLEMMRWLGYGMGLSLPKGRPLTSSIGAAARPQTFQDPVAYARSIYTAIASGKGKDPAKETAKNTGKTNEILEKQGGMWENFRKLWEDMKKSWDNLKLPEFKFPELKLPELKIPDWLKDLKLPDLKLPEFKLPEFKLPELKLPDLKFPELKLPELKFPELKFPDLSGPLTDAANKIPDAIKNALTDLPDKIAQAIRSNLPSLPSLPMPSLPTGNGNPLGDATRRARRWFGWP